MHGEIEAWRRKLWPSRETFRPRHVVLPEIFPEITNRTSDPRAARHVGIFSCNAHIVISTQAMLSSTYFDHDINLHPLPAEFGGTKEAQHRCLLLTSIANPFREVPPKFNVGKDSTPADQISKVNALLVAWIKDSIAKMSSAKAIERGILPEHFGVKIIRSLYFVAEYKAGSDEDIQTLYQDVLNVFSVWAMQRYMKLLLEPLVQCLDKERGGYLPRVKPLTEEMVNLVTAWNLYFPNAAAESLEVSTSICSQIIQLCSHSLFLPLGRAPAFYRGFPID